MAHIRLVQNRAKVSGNKTSDSEDVRRKVLACFMLLRISLLSYMANTHFERCTNSPFVKVTMYIPPTGGIVTNFL